MIRCTRLLDLLNTLDPKLVAAAFGMGRLRTMTTAWSRGLPCCCVLTTAVRTLTGRVHRARVAEQLHVGVGSPKQHARGSQFVAREQ